MRRIQRIIDLYYDNPALNIPNMQTLEERKIGVYDPYDLTDKLVGKEINGSL